eukprot:IDg15329t1
MEGTATRRNSESRWRRGKSAVHGAMPAGHARANGALYFLLLPRRDARRSHPVLYDKHRPSCRAITLLYLLHSSLIPRVSLCQGEKVPVVCYIPRAIILRFRFAAARSIRRARVAACPSIRSNGSRTCHPTMPPGHAPDHALQAWIRGLDVSYCAHCPILPVRVHIRVVQKKLLYLGNWSLICAATFIWTFPSLAAWLCAQLTTEPAKKNVHNLPPNTFTFQNGSSPCPAPY